jgi:hypothetical protein
MCSTCSCPISGNRMGARPQAISWHQKERNGSAMFECRVQQRMGEEARRRCSSTTLLPNQTHATSTMEGFWTTSRITTGWIAYGLR